MAAVSRVYFWAFVNLGTAMVMRIRMIDTTISNSIRENPFWRWGLVCPAQGSFRIRVSLYIMTRRRRAACRQVAREGRALGDRGGLAQLLALRGSRLWTVVFANHHRLVGVEAAAAADAI